MWLVSNTERKRDIWFSDLEENSRIWSSDLMKNARIVAENWKNRDSSRKFEKNRDLARKTLKIAICRGEWQKSRFRTYRDFLLSLFESEINAFIDQWVAVWERNDNLDLFTELFMA